MAMRYISRGGAPASMALRLGNFGSLSSIRSNSWSQPTSSRRSIGSAKSDVVLHRFHPVIDDGTVADAIQELPHTARNGSGAAHHMGKVGAVLRTRCIHAAEITLQKHAAACIAF